jgi:hypothetical protein
MIFEVTCNEVKKVGHGLVTQFHFDILSSVQIKSHEYEIIIAFDR